MVKELLKTTAKVLGKHKLPSTALEALHDEMRNSKRELDAVLGLNESNLFRVSISLDRQERDVRKEYPQTYAAIVHLLNTAISAGAAIDLESISLTNNSVKVKGQEGKLSRVLSKQLKGNEGALKSSMKELNISKPEQFLPKLGDIVKSGRKLWISTNILDFIYASEHAAFTSCHSLTGCHFNGNLAYARDNFTLITFVSDDKADTLQHEIYKLGRSWMFVVNNTIIQPKSYGAYYDFERATARGYIEAKIAENLKLHNKWLRNSENSLEYVYFETPEDKYSGTGALYLDNYDLDIRTISGLSRNVPEVNFSAAICLECGQTTDYPSKGVCSEHDGKIKAVCDVCGERHLIEQLYAVGDGETYVCPRCYEERYTRCAYCGQAHLRENVETIQGRSVCAACKNTLFAPCADCGELHVKDSMLAMEGVGRVCANCAENYLLCSTCGKHHHKDKVKYYPYVGRVCDECFPTVTFTCSECGEVHPNSNKKSGKAKAANKGLCPACVAKQAGEVVELKVKPKYAGLPEGWDDYIEEVG